MLQSVLGAVVTVKEAAPWVEAAQVPEQLQVEVRESEEEGSDLQGWGEGDGVVVLGE